MYLAWQGIQAVVGSATQRPSLGSYATLLTPRPLLAGMLSISQRVAVANPTVAACRANSKWLLCAGDIYQANACSTNASDDRWELTNVNGHIHKAAV